MEARLIQARKHSAKQTAGPSSFYVHKEERGGIPVSYDLYKGLSGNCLDITQEATDFLLEILGPKGAWIGWHLLAIGSLKKRDNVPYFDVVLARKSEAKPLLTPETDYFEMVPSPDKTVPSPDKMVPSPEKMVTSAEKKVSLPESSSYRLTPMSCGDGPYHCIVLPRKSEANPLSTFLTNQFEIVPSPEKVASAPEKMDSAPGKQTWW